MSWNLARTGTDSNEYHDAKELISKNGKLEVMVISDEQIAPRLSRVVTTDGNQSQYLELNFGEVKNPRTNRYVKIDRDAGKIVAHKKSEGPYKDVPVARKRK